MSNKKGNYHWLEVIGGGLRQSHVEWFLRAATVQQPPNNEPHFLAEDTPNGSDSQSKGIFWLVKPVFEALVRWLQPNAGLKGNRY